MMGHFVTLLQCIATAVSRWRVNVVNLAADRFQHRMMHAHRTYCMLHGSRCDQSQRSRTMIERQTRLSIGLMYSTTSTLPASSCLCLGSSIKQRDPQPRSIVRCSMAKIRKVVKRAVHLNAFIDRWRHEETRPLRVISRRMGPHFS